MTVARAALASRRANSYEVMRSAVIAIARDVPKVSRRLLSARSMRGRDRSPSLRASLPNERFQVRECQSAGVGSLVLATSDAILDHGRRLLGLHEIRSLEPFPALFAIDFDEGEPHDVSMTAAASLGNDHRPR